MRLERKAAIGITLALFLSGMLVFVPVSEVVGPSEKVGFDGGETNHTLAHSIAASKYTSMRFMDPNLDTFLRQDEDSIEIIIGVKRAFKGNYEKVTAIITENRGKIIDTILMEGNPRAVVADVPHETLSSIEWKLLNQGLARYVEPNMRLRLATVPNDPEWHVNWGLGKIKAQYAWNTTTGEPSVVIAVVDTGVDWNHPDLANNIWNNTDEMVDGKDNDGNGFVDDIRGWDFVDTSDSVWPGEDGTGRDNNPMDFHGHGTHCAGIAAAVGNNSVGVCGVTWNSKIMPVRAGYKGADGGGYLELDDAAAAIIYASDNGAHIISCSWGVYYSSHIIREAVEYAYDAGVILVAAAGNELTDEKLYPAAYEEVMAISATNDRDRAALFSNFGDWIELAAPGTDIYSTIFNDSYDFMSGTSMATPFVAGVAALVWSKFPNMNKDQVRERLRFTSDDLGEAGFDVRFGYGRINAREAVELEQEPHDLAIFRINIDSIALVGEPVYVDVTVLNTGTSDEHNVIVQFLVNSSLIKSEKVTQLASGKLKYINFLWNTSECLEGYYNLSAHVVPVDGENRTENNFLSKKVFVRVPRVIEVPREFATIQEAIDEAFEGDTIMVAPGTYSENLFIYTDSLKLKGEDASTTIIDGSGSNGDVILVWGANRVEIRGFTVRNSQRSPTREPPFSGILVHHCENVKVSNVLAVNNRGGIFLYCSYNVTLKENRMKGNKFNFGVDGNHLSNFIHRIDESNTVEEKPLRYLINKSNQTVSTPTGCVILVNSTNIKLKNLELVQNYAGIFCLASTNVTIFDSEASLNQIGVYVLNCDSVIVHSTIMTKNYVGIMVEDSENVTIENNFVSGMGIFSDGILFDHSTKCQARLNILNKNRINLWLCYSNENVVTKNEVSIASFSGISLTNAHNNLLTKNWLFNNIESALPPFSDGIALNIEMSFNNCIYHNHFVNNTYKVFITDSANTYDNGYPLGGNYWSDYNGTDFYSSPHQNETGSDGIGDTPYVIEENNQDRYPLMSPYPCIHAVAAKDVKPIKTVVGQGLTTKMYVDVANLGHFTETFNVTTYANTTEIGKQTVTNLNSGTNRILSFTWNTTGFAIGNYTISAVADVVTNETDTADNTYIDGMVTVRLPIHDVAVVDVAPSKTVVGQGYSASIKVTIENQGDYTETFNVTAYCKEIVITLPNGKNHTTINLTSRNSTTVIFTWNTTSIAKGNYTIKAMADILPGEIDTDNNNFSGGWIIVAMVGDLTGSDGYPDDKVDIRDIAHCAIRYGCIYQPLIYPPPPCWDPNCDIDNNGKIDIRDIATIAIHFGEIDP